MFKRAVAGALAMLLLAGCGIAPSGGRPWGKCAVLGAIAGAGLAGAGLLAGAYSADANVDVLGKIRKGEPLAEAVNHHSETTQEIMLYGGLLALPLGAVAGAIAGDYYCDAELS